MLFFNRKETKILNFTSTLVLLICGSYLLNTSITTDSAFTQSGTGELTAKSQKMAVSYTGQDSDYIFWGTNAVIIKDDDDETIKPGDNVFEKTLTVTNTGNVDMLFSLDSNPEPYENSAESNLEVEVLIDGNLEFRGPLTELVTGDKRLNVGQSSVINVNLSLPADQNADFYTQNSNAWIHHMIEFRPKFVNGALGFDFPGRNIYVEATMARLVDDIFQYKNSTTSTTAELGIRRIPQSSGYTYEYSTSPAFENSTVAHKNDPVNSSGQDTYLLLNGLTPGTKYYVRIITDNPLHENAWSQVYTFTTLP